MRPLSAHSCETTYFASARRCSCRAATLAADWPNRPVASHCCAENGVQVVPRGQCMVPIGCSLKLGKDYPRSQDNCVRLQSRGRRCSARKYNVLNENGKRSSKTKRRRAHCTQDKRYFQCCSRCVPHGVLCLVFKFKTLNQLTKLQIRLRNTMRLIVRFISAHSGCPLPHRRQHKRQHKCRHVYEYNRKVYSIYTLS